eukprot:scaffold2449_cov340-Prasinococcus_capsulatus_cf.AAC.6
MPSPRCAVPTSPWRRRPLAATTLRCTPSPAPSVRARGTPRPLLRRVPPPPIRALPCIPWRDAGGKWDTPGFWDPPGPPPAGARVAITRTLQQPLALQNGAQLCDLQLGVRRPPIMRGRTGGRGPDGRARRRAWPGGGRRRGGGVAGARWSGGRQRRAARLLAGLPAARGRPWGPGRGAPGQRA